MSNVLMWVSLRSVRASKVQDKKQADIVKDRAMAFKKIANERLFLMKDLAAVEEAVGMGAKIYEGASPF
jgi:hypothetical protein